MTVRVRYGDRKAAELDARVREIAGTAIESYTALFGRVPDDARGEPLHELALTIAHGPGRGGESDPGLVSVTIGERPVFGFYGWELTLLHELFHLWSAGTFRHETCAEPWFDEGVAELYTLRTAVEIGFLSPEEVVSATSTLLGFYLSATDIGKLSLREAGSTPEEKRAHCFLVHDGGLAALFLMRWLAEHFDRGGRLYDMDDLINGLRETTGVDVRAFFTRYVDGLEPVPVGQYLDLGRLSFDLAAAGAERSPDPYLSAALGIDAR